MAKIAIPILEEKLSSKFSECGHYDVFFIDHLKVVSKKQLKGCSQSVEELNSWIKTNEITDVIAHGIDKKWVAYFSGTKVNLYIGVNIKSPEQLISEYLEGSLRSDSQYITK